MTAAVDTDVLVYAEGLGDAARRRRATELLDKLAVRLVLPARVLGELYNVLTRKGGWTPEQARQKVLRWHDILATFEATGDGILAAIEVAAAHKLNVWDAALLVASDAAGCDVLLSEDLQEGFRWRGVTVVNPFAAHPHPLLITLLADA